METRKFEILLIFLSPEFVNSFPTKAWNSQREKFFEKNRFSAILGPLFLSKGETRLRMRFCAQS
jgi:hypothetical protein